MQTMNLIEMGVFPGWFKYGRNVKIRVNTLSALYCIQKAMEFVEPQREGVAKGETVGFSKAKQEAALFLALYNKTLKEIAESLGISYGVLRVWNIEEAFRAMKHRIRREYAALVVDWISDVVPKERDRVEGERMKRDPSDVKFSDGWLIGWGEFSDYGDYHEDVQAMIELSILKIVEESQDDPGKQLYLLGFIGYINPYPDPPELLNKRKHARNRLKDLFFADIKAMLSKRQLTNRDKMSILFLVRVLCEPEPVEGGAESEA